MSNNIIYYNMKTKTIPGMDDVQKLWQKYITEKVPCTGWYIMTFIVSQAKHNVF